MSKALTLYDTAVGKKAAVAVTGLMLYGFVIVHMLGNLQVFGGAEMFNHYASFYKDNPGPLWAARGILIFVVLVHIVLTMQLAREARVARPTRYRKHKSQAATFSGKWMIVSGPILFLFILFHLWNLTAPGWIPGADFSHRDVYANFISNFQSVLMVIGYGIANLMLGLHLAHGAWSMFQTMGISNSRYNLRGKVIAVSIGGLVAAGNIFMPIAVVTGIIGPESWTRECPVTTPGACEQDEKDNDLTDEIGALGPADTIHADATEVR